MKSFRKEDVVGKTVIETSGNVKGQVTDVLFDLGGSITFLVKARDGTESQVKISDVTGIMEHVVVKGSQASGDSPKAGNTCRFCGATVSQGASWCPSCGKSLI
jgi:sporulation protein YlmC with PRC-barrel domain